LCILCLGDLSHGHFSRSADWWLLDVILLFLGLSSHQELGLTLAGLSRGGLVAVYWSMSSKVALQRLNLSSLGRHEEVPAFILLLKLLVLKEFLVLDSVAIR